MVHSRLSVSNTDWEKESIGEGMLRNGGMRERERNVEYQDSL